MYGIFTYIYLINDPNVGKYTIHGSSGIVMLVYLQVLNALIADSDGFFRANPGSRSDNNFYPAVPYSMHTIYKWNKTCADMYIYIY